MNIRKLIVLVAALGMGATLAASNQQVVVQPSQAGGQGGSIVRPIESTVLKGQPYSAAITNETVQMLGDGNRIVQRTTARVYRDVEGRVRREDDRAGGTTTISISDPVSGLQWTLDPVNKTARETVNANFADFMANLRERVVPAQPSRTEPPTPPAGGVARSAGAGGGGGRGGRIAGSSDLPSREAVPVVARGGGVGGGGRGGRPSDERVVEELPNKSIENLLCTGVRRTTTIAKGAIGNEQPIKIVSEEWTSIDLKVLVLTDLNDPRSGHTTYKLTNVRRADPDISLFKVPADYTVTRVSGGRGRGGN